MILLIMPIIHLLPKWVKCVLYMTALIVGSGIGTLYINANIASSCGSLCIQTHEIIEKCIKIDSIEEVSKINFRKMRLSYLNRTFGISDSIKCKVTKCESSALNDHEYCSKCYLAKHPEMN